MTTMNVFNFLAGLASFAGLVFSIWITYRTGKIQEKIELNHLAEEFNINRDSIMDDLRSSGLNAIRTDFPDDSIIFEFQRKLLEYSKQQNKLLTETEQKHIEELISLINTSDIKTDGERKRFKYLLNEITTKPNIWRN